MIEPRSYHLRSQAYAVGLIGFGTALIGGFAVYLDFDAVGYLLLVVGWGGVAAGLVMSRVSDYKNRKK